MDIELPTAENPVVVIEGDCLDVLPMLPAGCVDAVVTDPPYGEGFDFDGDDSPTIAANLLGQFLSSFRAEKGTLLACFWTMRSLDFLMDECRSRGWSYLRTLAMHANGTARPHMGFVPRLQPIAIFRLGSRANELHDRFSIAAKKALSESGMSCGRVAIELNCDSRLVQKWTRYRDPSWCLPTARFYGRFKILIGMGDEFDEELEGWARSSGWQPTGFSQDLFVVKGQSCQVGHPCEKPVAAMQWLIRGLPSETILDPFAGSGTTGVAAILEGRRAILIEKDQAYCEIIRRRIAETLCRPVTLKNGRRVGENLFAGVS